MVFILTWPRKKNGQDYEKLGTGPYQLSSANYRSPATKRMVPVLSFSVYIRVVGFFVLSFPKTSVFSFPPRKTRNEGLCWWKLRKCLSFVREPRPSIRNPTESKGQRATREKRPTKPRIQSPSEVYQTPYCTPYETHTTPHGRSIYAALVFFYRIDRITTRSVRSRTNPPPPLSFPSADIRNPPL